MRKLYTLLAFLILCVHAAVAGPGHLLPKPQQCDLTADGAKFALNRSIALTAPQSGDADPAVEAELTQLIETYGGSVDAGSGAAIVVTLVDNVAGAEFQDEAYSLTIAPDRVDLKAKTLRGAYWGVQTLWQLAEENDNGLNCGTILDWAAFKLRGYTHDVGRGYLEFDELLNQIEKLSRYKINTFHWHLTENQGWRLESKVYPQLNANSSYTRLPGKYYTIEQAKQLVTYASRHGITVIPEIDMPGHSEAFRKAMGHSMLTTQGLAEMKAIMTEACETFSGTDWMHIGTDELRSEDQGTMNWTSFVPQMVSHIRGLGKKVVSWNPGYSYTSADIDMIQMWSSSGRPITGVPTIDSRYHYANHFDNYADIVSLYKSTIADQAKGSDQYAGVIVSFWNDRYLPSDEAIIKQNSLYSSMLAIAERSWMGGGDGYFPQVGTLLLRNDTAFFDWEERFLFHKDHFLQTEPIPYVKQSHMRWRITDQFPNGGTLTAAFPPETSGISDNYTYNGTTYGASDALGGGVYLRHVWGTSVPGFYANPQTNHTAYAYTYVFSPEDQQVGLIVEFQNYSRSETDLAAPQGKWDYKESRIWINDNEIAPPTWENTHTTKSSEVTLKNENMTARDPIPVTLHQGWNKIMMKLPVGSFSQNETRMVKWMFNCVLTTPDGRDAAPGLVYSPDRIQNPAMEVLIDALSRANAAKSGVEIGNNPGQYTQATINEFNAAIAEAQVVRNDETLDDEAYNEAARLLNEKIEAFADAWNRPKISTPTKEYWYKIYAPGRENRVVAYRSNNGALYGETYAIGQTKHQWKFVELQDGTVAIVSRYATSHISPNSAYNTALKAQTGVPTSGGWQLKYINNGSYFIVVSGEQQLNQTTSAHSYQVYNWGSGTQTTDGGCLFKFEMVATSDTNPLPTAINAAQQAVSGVTIGDEPGEYSQTTVDELNDAIAKAQTVANNGASTDEEVLDAYNALESARLAFLDGYNTPEISTPWDEYWYTISSVRDGEKAMTWTTGYTYGSAYTGAQTQHWKFVLLDDGTYAIVNRSQDHYLLTDARIASGGNSSVKVFGSQTGLPDGAGWKYTFLRQGVLFALHSDLPSQMHMLNSGSTYKIGNYGITASTGAINTTDVGCKFTIKFREHEQDLNALDRLSDDDALRFEITGNQLTLYAEAGQLVGLYDVAGVALYQKRVAADGEISVAMPRCGFFILRIDDRGIKIVR
ncbi:MAG: family 20 glycosylhydrolase [Bacteroides sp.]|nr:family 20 glycosylhydrolase [Bacteroides sp.]MCM1413525.1 family 20 glycosylhydrolase [Bacteroides sp.]MCM1471079.1 family 20 glycosylhydrolase [Bacteroides sp.]